jgi:hypothetical protein
MKSRELVWGRGGALLALALGGAVGAIGCLGDGGGLGNEDVTETSSALTGYTVVVADSALDSNSSKQLSVACPTGARALGAGWSALDSTSAILNGRATYTAPSFDGTSWLTNATNLSSFSPVWKLRVRVLCGSAALAGYQVVTAETAVNTSSPKQLSVGCPAGKLATGAGWGVLDPTGVILAGEATYFLPSFDGKSWLINARNNSTFAPSWKLKGFLLCANTAALAGYQVVTSDTAVSAASLKQLNVSCPTGKHATGAGWGVLDPTSAILDGDALYFLPGFDGASWLTNAQNNSTFAPTWKLRVTALCTN